MNPPRNRKGESGSPLPKASASEFYPNQNPSMSEMAFYEKVIKVKADVAAYLINCFPSA